MSSKSRYIFKPALDAIRGKVLDIGCREGLTLEQLGNGVGLDISLKDLRKSRRKGLNVVLGSGEVLPFKTNSFGTILCMQTIEHLQDYISALREFYRVLENGGTLLLEFPNASSVIDRGWDRPDHVSFFSPDSMRRHMESVGFGVTRIWAGCRYVENPILKRLWLVLSRFLCPFWGNIWIFGEKGTLSATHVKSRG